MSHNFFVRPGFLSGSSPYHETFALVEAAAHECSLEPRCRGFTLSLSYMEDGKMHYVRFYEHATTTLSAEWLSYIKEPLTAHQYTFAPGYLTHADAGQSASILHRQYTTLLDAHSFCDGEATCEGFVLRRQPGAVAEMNAELAWVSFIGRSSTRPVLAVFEAESVSYRKGRPLLPRTPAGSTSGNHRAGGTSTGASISSSTRTHTYTLQLGFLFDGARPSLEQHQATLEEGERWCSAHPLCVGFSTPLDTSYLEGAGERAWLTYWGAGARLAFASEWATYAQDGQGALGAYMLQPGFLVTDGVAAPAASASTGFEYGVEDANGIVHVEGGAISYDDGKFGSSAPQPLLLADLYMSIDEGRAWCDRRRECVGFSLHVAVPPSAIAQRSEEDNQRQWLRFGRRLEVHQSPQPVDCH